MNTQVSYKLGQLRQDGIVSQDEVNVLLDSMIGEVNEDNLPKVEKLLGRKLVLEPEDTADSNKNNEIEIKLCQDTKSDGTPCQYRAKYPKDNPKYCGHHWKAHQNENQQEEEVKDMSKAATKEKLDLDFPPVKENKSEIEELRSLIKTQAEQINKLTNALSSSTSSNRNTSAQPAHTVLKNKQDKAYGVKFNQIEGRYKNRVKALIVNRSMQEGTTHYGKILGAKSTVNFTLVQIGKHHYPQYKDSKGQPLEMTAEVFKHTTKMVLNHSAKAEKILK